MKKAQRHGYHLKPIKKGTLGEFSKIKEELDEIQDASRQNVKILLLCEYCDLIGAIEEYCKKYNGFTLNDLLTKSKAYTSKGETEELNKLTKEATQLNKKESKWLLLIKLCQILQFVEANIEKYNMSVQDLIAMKELTKNAFLTGHR